MNQVNHASLDEGSYWLLITVRVVRELEEDISALLFELGSTGIVTLTEDADAITLGAYFNSRAVTEVIKQTIESECLRINRPDALSVFSSSLVPNQDWMQKWKEGFEPIEIGSRLIVAPSWKVPAQNENRLVVQIDPGMAFGTGARWASLIETSAASSNSPKISLHSGRSSRPCRVVTIGGQGRARASGKP